MTSNFSMFHILIVNDYICTNSNESMEICPQTQSKLQSRFEEHSSFDYLDEKENIIHTTKQRPTAVRGQKARTTRQIHPARQTDHLSCAWRVHFSSKAYLWRNCLEKSPPPKSHSLFLLLSESVVYPSPDPILCNVFTLNAEITINPKEVKARRGATVRFHCAVTLMDGSQPKSSSTKVTWMRVDRQTLRAGREEIVTGTGGSNVAVLVVKQIDEDYDNVTYICTDGVWICLIVIVLL